MPDAWKQQPNESGKAFAAFKAYLELGHERTLRAVARKVGKNRKLIEGWSSRWGWTGRVKAWEADCERREDEARDKLYEQKAMDWAAIREKIKREDYELGTELRAKARAILQFPLAKTVTKRSGKEIHIYPARFTIQSAAKMSEVGSKLQRISAGLPTDKTELSGPDNGPLPIPPSTPAEVHIYIPDNNRDKKK